jgi:cation diffusion facilitator CzcD-associated flavoprotein CzcO
MIWSTLAATAVLAALVAADDAHEYHKFDKPIKRVAVIGAGPAGLQAAATLKEHNFTTVRLFERQEKPGGTWYYQESTPVREPYP